MKITFSKDDISFILPVTPPGDQLGIRYANKNSKVDMLEIGEVSIPGKRELISLSFSSHFPYEYRPYCKVKPIKEPMAYISIIKAWVESNDIINVDLEDFISLNCRIESFTPLPPDGAKDITYSMDIVEAIDFSITTVPALISSSEVVPLVNNRSVIQVPNEQVYIVKKGDYLIKIAKQFYGDDSRWQEIAEKNNITNPRALQIGQQLVIP